MSPRPLPINTTAYVEKTGRQPWGIGIWTFGFRGVDARRVKWEEREPAPHPCSYPEAVRWAQGIARLAGAYEIEALDFKLPTLRAVRNG